MTTIKAEDMRNHDGECWSFACEALEGVDRGELEAILRSLLFREDSAGRAVGDLLRRILAVTV